MRSANLVDVNLKRDIQEISSYIQSYIDATYLSQIRNQIETHKRQWEAVPFAEVQLLEAMIPFVEEETKDKILNGMKMITYSKMIESMLPEYGIDIIFNRSDNKTLTPNDYIYQAVAVLVLYKVIRVAEGYNN